MKLADAIRSARAQQDTELPDEVLIGWLSALDGLLWEDVVCKYEDPERKYPTQAPAYGADTDREGTELMVTAPHDEMYPTYLVMRIHLDHADMDRYNNTAELFNRQRDAWSSWFNRSHRWAASGQYREPRPRYYDTQIIF